jgi:hypothetical protein
MKTNSAPGEGPKCRIGCSEGVRRTGTNGFPSIPQTVRPLRKKRWPGNRPGVIDCPSPLRFCPPRQGSRPGRDERLVSTPAVGAVLRPPGPAQTPSPPDCRGSARATHLPTSGWQNRWWRAGRSIRPAVYLPQWLGNPLPATFRIRGSVAFRLWPRATAGSRRSQSRYQRSIGSMLWGSSVRWRQLERCRRVHP